MDDLRKELELLAHLDGVSSLLSWDQETYMPKGAIRARSEQLAALSGIRHDRLTSAAFQSILNQYVCLESGKPIQPVTERDRLILFRVFQDWRKAKQIPSAFVSSFAALKSQSQHVWQEARDCNDFALFAPYLEKCVAMSTEQAQMMNPDLPAYDTLLDEFEEGSSVSVLNPLFLELKDELQLLLLHILEKRKATKLFLGRTFDIQKQWDFGMKVLGEMGFDFNRGRQDRSTHPFTTQFHPTDVRVTTRLSPDNFLEALSSTIHEGGHALYEQGLQSDYFGTALCESVSLGFHESQSRLWEQMIGMGAAFWSHYYPILQSYFPESLNDVDSQLFYHAINTVSKSLIRVEADEVTYNLHIVIRYECEKMLFDKTLSVASLPGVWNQKYKDYLGVMPSSDCEGVLQDVHWSCALFGYFPTYTLGNLYAAHLYEQMRKDFDIEEKISQGQLKAVMEWNRDHIHCHGRLFSPKELLEKVCHCTLSTGPFLSYLNKKYLEIYGR